MNNNAKIALAAALGVLVGARYSKTIDSTLEARLGVDLVPDNSPLINLVSTSKPEPISENALTLMVLAGGLAFIAIREVF